LNEELQVVKQHMNCERRLREKVATGPISSVKFMLPKLPEITPEAREKTHLHRENSVFTSENSILPVSSGKPSTYLIKWF
jgi:hypothetical protein